MSRGTKAIISQSALLHNYAMVKHHAPDAKVWAVVKANAYGHGALDVVQTLNDADGYAVATLDEALALRTNGVRSPILLLEGVTEIEHWSDVVANNLDCVVHCAEQINQFERLSLSGELNLWVKVDTGMHRLGIQPESMTAIRARLAQISKVSLCGVMTHLACADEVQNPKVTEQQIATFNALIETTDTVSIANSSGIMQWPTTHRDWVRPGIMLYGASPVSGQTGKDFGLQPVMTLQAPVIAIRTVTKGDSVGYGHRWTAQKDARIATLAIGYGDGYPRHAPNDTPVWINGQIVSLVGRVSMDMIMIDVTDVDSVDVGSVAELWGNNIAVDDVAQRAGTIGYELLTGILPRVTHELKS